MPASESIEFRELGVPSTDFLHELQDPAILKTKPLPPKATAELRRRQVERLRANIFALNGKRDEFNRKIAEYVENLKALIRSIERAIQSQAPQSDAAGAEGETPATLVRCLGCDTHKVFRDIQVVFARESLDAMDRPTEVYVLEGSTLKKGQFHCAACGTENLLIRNV
jgi:hypothetical protein